jgi:hypothetical protein
MMRRGTVAAAILLALGPAACSGNTSPAPPLEAHRAPLDRAQDSAPSACSTACLYVTNSFNDSITVYATNANGNVAPIRTIGGASTGLSSPFGIALDFNRNIYVANGGTGSSGFSLTVYAAGSSGNVAPVRTISGSSTLLYDPFGPALDASRNMYVANFNNTVTVYAANANGNVAPIQTVSGSSTGLNHPFGITLDASRNIYVSNGPLPDGPFSVTVYAAGATGNVAPIRTIGGSKAGLSGPGGIAVDAAGNLYAANYHPSSVTVYGAGANGNVAPTRTIGGSKTGLTNPYGIAVGGHGLIYVTNLYGNSVTVYAAGANGNVAPIRTIYGSMTGLSVPSGVAIH